MSPADDTDRTVADDRDVATGEDGGRSGADGGRSGADGRDGPEVAAGVVEPPAAGTFDWRGWTLVAAIVVALIVVPIAILYLPSARGLIRSLGLSLRDAYLVLPLLPAFGLGAIAVWSAVRSRSR